MNKILVYSQNLDNIYLCDTLDPKNKSLLNKIGLESKCNNPNFLYKIQNDINVYNPFLVAISTEDELKKNNNFHNKLLKNFMDNLNFKQLKVKKLDKIKSNNITRLSIYVHNTLYKDFEYEEKDIDRNFNNNGQYIHVENIDERSLGVIVSIVWHPIYGRFAFSTFNLTSENDKIYYNKEIYYKYRQYIIASNTSIINFTKFKVESIKKFKRPEYFIIMGNLGFNIIDDKGIIQSYINDNNEFSVEDIKNMIDKDELRVNHILSEYKEGPSNDGPFFLPTSVLKKGRDLNLCSSKYDKMHKNYYKNCIDEFKPLGWRERILYKELEGSNSNYTLNCIEYNRNDSIADSDNAAVYAIFELIERKIVNNN